MGFKVAVLGAGSIGFTRTLIRDLLAVPEFRSDAGIEIAFHDISARNLEMITQLMRREMEANSCAARLSATLDRREALTGANYVLNVTRIGGLEAFAADVEIPLKYGVDQCVGDTLCAGGIFYGQRNIAAILDFCKDMREVSHPDVLFLNYANPNAMNTWAAEEFGGVRAIGLCHGVEGGHHQIVQVIEGMINEGKGEGETGYRKVSAAEVDIICAGINHQTWYTKVMFEGQDWAQRLEEGFRRHPKFARTEKARISMIRNFGYYSTESNGHFSEYVSWFRKRPENLHKWIDMEDWILGETGGYLRVCTEGRNWFETDFPNWMKEEPVVFGPGRRSSEHGSHIIESLETGRISRRHSNVKNNGCIRNLPDDCVVEVPVYYDRIGINVPRVGALPAGCAAICQNSVNVQRLAVEAAVKGDVGLLQQAMMLDPLVGAVCDPDEIWQMTMEMLIAGEKWLPQYARVMPAIRAEFSGAKKLGTRVTEGGARKKTRSVEELSKDKQAQQLAKTADKGGHV